MSSLHTLQRLREHARQDSHQKLRRAEGLREEQQGRLDAVQAAVADARATRDPTDLVSLSAYHAFRLRQEIAERRETARLAQREREVEAARTHHSGRVRDELAVQNVIEMEAERFVALQRTAETRALDEVGARMRRVA